MVKGEGVPMRLEAPKLSDTRHLPDLTGAGHVPTPISTVPGSETPQNPTSWQSIRARLLNTPCGTRRVLDAEMIYHSKLVDSANRLTREPGVLADLLPGQRIAGMIEASDALYSGKVDVFEQGNSTWGARGSDLVRHVLQSDATRYEVYLQVTELSDRDLAKQVKRAKRTLRRVPRMVRTLESDALRDARQAELDRQRTMAVEIAMTDRLVGTAAHDARRFFRRPPHERATDVASVQEYVDGVVAASDALNAGGARAREMAVGRSLLGEAGSEYMRVAEQVKADGERLRSASQKWTEEDVERTLNEAHGTQASLPYGLRHYLYERTELKPEGLRGKLKRYKDSVTANVAAIAGAEGAGYLGGLLGVLWSPFAGADLKSTIAAIATGAGSYYLWGRQLLNSADRNFELIEKKGTSTSVLAKKWYDKYRYAGEHVQRRMTRLGSAAYDLGGEIHYYAAAAVTWAVTDLKTALTGLAFANLAAAIKERIQADLTEIATTKDLSLKTVVPDILKLEAKKAAAQYERSKASVIDITHRLRGDKEGGKEENAA